LRTARRTLREIAILIYGRERIGAIGSARPPSHRAWPRAAAAIGTPVAGSISAHCELYLPKVSELPQTGGVRGRGGPAMFEDDDSPFLTIDETAEPLRAKLRTLDNLRSHRKGRPARRHGGRIVYHCREVLDWSEGRRTGTLPPRPSGTAAPRPGGNARDRPPGDLKPTNRPPTRPVERKP